MGSEMCIRDRGGIPGANVKVKGGTAGTITNMDGQFTLSVPSSKSILVVSYIGYIVNSDSQHFYEKWVRPFVNIKHLKGVIADEDRKQHQACVAV